ncbi:hypothetical protein BBJ28_00020845 [Nothophytophthora sp. Chile5]|nr:hypothetical protein BBJ28_00020845 [Nothophytophthora sp. Chile5]
MATATRSRDGHLALRTAVLGAVTAVAALLGYLSPSQADFQPPQTHSSLFPSTLESRSPLGDQVFAVGAGGVGGEYAFGRWKEPVQNVTGRHPGSMGLTFAASSIDGDACSSFRPVGATVAALSFCYNATSRGWTLRANAPLYEAVSGESRKFTADLQLKQEEAMILLFPLGNDTMRPAYVHKASGSPVTGTFQFGNTSVALTRQQLSTPALGALDWTRTMALRCTRWHWVSASFRANVTTRAINTNSSSAEATEAAVGINLSADVYDIGGESQENAVWIDGRVHVLRGVAFSVPDQPVQDAWRIRSQPGIFDEAVDLTFTPRGSREDHTRALVVVSDFVQPYGTLCGLISFTTEDGQSVTIEVVDAFGVAEKHFALW